MHTACLRSVSLATALALLASPPFALPRAAAALPRDVARLVDARVDPCDDFYAYACGAWVRNATLADDEPARAYAWDTVADRNARVLQRIVRSRSPLVSEFWDACMAVDALTQLGNAPLLPVLQQIGAATDKRELMRLAAKIGATGATMLTDIGVAADDRNASTYALFGAIPSLVLPDASYYLDDDAFAGVETAYREYITAMLTHAGVDITGQRSDGDDGDDDDDTAFAENAIVTLERQLAVLAPSEAELRDPAAAYNPLALDEACAAYPLAFGALADARQLLQQPTLTRDSTVVLPSRAYYAAVEQLIGATDIEVLRVYLAFVYVDDRARFLGEPFLETRFAFFGRTLSGLAARAPRDRYCASQLTAFLPHVVGRHFYREAFDDARARDVQRMVDAVEAAMDERIRAVDWLDDATRAAARRKLARVENLIGQPNPTATATDENELALSRDDFVGNAAALAERASTRMLARIGARVDRSEWALSAATVNAYYAPTQNQMVFPAAILQPPFYDAAAANTAQNFGAIGAIIGHELTHGFDTLGRRYDGDGNRREWWTPATAAAFEERAQCLRDQYGAFEVVGASSGDVLGTVDGDQTIGENIADNGGVGLAWDAFHASQDVAGRSDERLFFLAYAQLWCSKARDEHARQRLARDVHAPSRFRVNGVAMNSAVFARVFQCQRGAKMNPETKCTLW